MKPKQTKANPEKIDNIKVQLTPGECVSTDQYVRRVKGCVSSKRKSEEPNSTYSGGTLFHDHASGFIYAEDQVGLGVSDTLKVKRNFDALAE